MDRAGGPVTITIEKNTEDLMEQARTSYDRALALDPKWVVALNNRSQLAWRYALIGHMKGENPDAWIQRAVSDAKSSLAVDGEQPRAHLMLSQALLFKANVMVDQHREATRELDLGARSILRAKALVQQTGAFLGWNSFYSVEAQFSAMKGANAINHGGDGRPMFRDAVRSAQRALETDPDSMSAIGLATNITMQLADAEDRLGGDPLPILGEAQQGFDRLLKKFPGQVQVLRDCAEVHRIRASQLVRRNQDPGVELKETQRLLAEGLAQAPKFHELHQVKGRAALVQARWERHLGENEAASLTMARAELQKAKALNPRIADLDSDLHEILEFQANRSRNL
jgi:tetratricopeptide (TPR) repeat protein